MLLALKIILAVILAVILSAILLLLFFLIIPLNYEFSLTGHPADLQFRFFCRNPLGLIETQRIDGQTSSRLRIFNHLIAPGAKKKSSAAARPPSASKKRQPSRTALLGEIAGDRALLIRIWKLVTALWKNLKPQQLNINACIGCSEPHYTGWLMAAVAMLPTDNSPYTIHIEGNWLEPGLDGDIYLIGRIIPALLIGQILKFLLSPEIRPHYNIRRRLAIART